jgi:hypothetical protein
MFFFVITEFRCENAYYCNEQAVDRVMMCRILDDVPADGRKPKSYEEALQSTVASLCGCDNAMVIVRPPGHHAGRLGQTVGTNSCGFCLLNNVCIGKGGAVDVASGVRWVWDGFPAGCFVFPQAHSMQ